MALLAGCGARPGTVHRAQAAQPAEPDWQWIRHYARARMLSELANDWPGRLRSAAEAESLPPDLNRILETDTDAALAGITRFRRTLARSLPAAACTPSGRAAAAALAGSLQKISRDYGFRPSISAMASQFDGFRQELNGVRCPGATPRLSQDGRAGLIHGFVYDAVSGRALAVVRVYALDPASNAIRQTKTSAAGAWSLAVARNTCYRVTAADEGYLPGEWLGSVGSPVVPSCRSFGVAGNGSSAGMVLRLHRSGVSTMAYGPLVEAYPFDQTALELASFVFSRDGRRLAFRAGGDIWQYSVSPRQLARVGSVPLGRCPAASLDWAGGSLVIRAGGCGRPFRYFVAGARGIVPARAGAAEVRVAFGPNQLKTLPLAEPPNPVEVGGYRLWLQLVDARPSGPVALMVQRVGAAPSVIAGKRQWTPVINALVDPDSGQVIYMQGSQPWIFAYALANGTTRRRALPGEPQAILAATRVAGGVRIAYSTYGACDGAPGYAPLRQVCLVTLHDPRRDQSR